MRTLKQIKEASAKEALVLTFLCFVWGMVLAAVVGGMIWLVACAKLAGDELREKGIKGLVDKAWCGNSGCKEQQINPKEKQ